MKNLTEFSNHLLNMINSTNNSTTLVNYEQKSNISKTEIQLKNEKIEDAYQMYLQAQEWGNKINKITRVKRYTEENITSSLPDSINIHLPNGIGQRNNPPANNDIIWAIKFATDIPSGLDNSAFRISYATRRGATVTVSGYYQNKHYIGSKYVNFHASRKKREVNNSNELKEENQGIKKETKLNNNFAKSINNEQNLPIDNKPNFVKSNITSL
ncbi:hypothetical protein [Spiroplasma endosymbiont of Zeiraphera isertana]|uniref:hypothetical protein n=1 Tax=Spiroplasma endosymbiont of Zeiraphera isertana TaxID=3066313 RepID=UPI00313DE590